MTCLASGGRLASVVVAVRDISLAELEALAADYLNMIGAGTELAHEMAFGATQLAAGHQPGTVLVAGYNFEADEWTFAPAEPAEAGAERW